MMPIEIWKEIKNYENLYEVSNYGKIKSINRIIKRGKNGNIPIKERILKSSINVSGYKTVALSKNNKKKIIPIHRLVAQTFISNPKNLPCVNHKDENKLNNCVDNLEWCTVKYNNNYGSKRNKISKKVIQYDKNKNIIKEWNSIIDVQRISNINNSNIVQCCKGKRKRAGGYVWEYKL